MACTLYNEVKTPSHCTVDLSEIDNYQLLEFKKSMINFLNEKFHFGKGYLVF